jgi:hypothetical protein
MSEEKTTLSLAARPERLLAPLSEGQALRIASRLGVWGSLVGFGSFFLMGIGVSLPLGLTSALVTAGLIGGGIGISATAGLVLRKSDKISKRVAVGAVAGLPLGLSVFFLGLQIFLEGILPLGLETISIYLIVVTTVVLGVVMGSGFWSQLRSADMAEDDIL